MRFFHRFIDLFFRTVRSEGAGRFMISHLMEREELPRHFMSQRPVF